LAGFSANIGSIANFRGFGEIVSADIFGDGGSTRREEKGKKCKSFEPHFLFHEKPLGVVVGWYVGERCVAYG
jgi:hypothetical protein